MKNTITIFLNCFLMISSLEATTLCLTPPVKKITIYWDTSLSMKDKDIDIELTFLATYFNKIPNVVVDLIAFSNSIHLQKSFTVVNSDWTTLKEELLKTNYDGVAFFDVLLEKTTSDMNFLFTDGIEIIDKLEINTTTPTYVVNSSKRANLTVLEQQGLLSSGNFIDLYEISIQEAKALLNLERPQKEITNKKKISKKKVISKTILNENFVTGSVFSSDGALLGATISVNGEKGVVTDSNGEFSIKATNGDILVISYLGMRTKEIVINESHRFDILLLNDETELDEVVVKGKSEPIIEMVETGYGKVNKEKLGYAVKTINEKQLMSGGATNISDALRGKMGAVHSPGMDLSLTVFRNIAAGTLLPKTDPNAPSPYALIVIDGIPIRRSRGGGMTNKTNKLADFIDPDNVASVTILKGLAATNRWGSEGGSGVILITTKSSLAGQKSEISKNTALLRDNDFTENLVLVNSAINEKYIEELKEFQTLNEIYNHYLKQRINYLDDPLYFVNVSDYIAQWENKELASKILSNTLELNPKDVSLLKLVAYKAEQQHHFFFAKNIYKKIAKLKPRDAQSYRDLALIYQETGYNQKALDIYKKILNNGYSGVNFSGVQKNIDNEMKRLLLLHKEELDLTGVANHNLNPKNVDYNARIVFDWNDRAAEFELQFVNPQKFFFTWSHTKAENAMRLHEEKTQGFNTEEFLLIDAEKGEWQINIESKISKSKKPVVLKYTVYRNYGKPNETKESKLLILNNLKEKQLAGKIII
jgi:tetratricopeptide (TPR) repeat protein